MLGRLEMDVDECISAYTHIMKDVFEEKAHQFPVQWRGRVQARFDSKKLQGAIESVIRQEGHSPTDRFNRGGPPGCRV